METALAALGAYAIGSISFAIVVSRLMQLPDPRSYGSGNPGATNVLRSGRKAAAVLTLLGDGGKGWLAVWLAATLAGTSAAAAAAGLAVFIGHLYPMFHRFRGGKGVATAAGVLLGFQWALGLGTLATWIIIAVFLRYSSLAALVAALFAAVFSFVLLGVSEQAFAVAIIALLLVWRHKANIARLLEGTEPRLGAKKAT
jgi:acyl phosphate:glycerol-3-phosphate acyltransferase